MRTLLPLILLAAALCVVRGGAQPNPAARRALPPGVKVLKDLTYGQVGSRDLKLDLYLPPDQGHPAPLIIWIHGGAWLSGNKDQPSPAVPLTAQGYAVAQVGYRLSPEALFPAQIHDCKGAVRWLRANASLYHLDPDRFAAWGSSAGGHLVALLGTSSAETDLEGSVNDLKTSSRVQAVVDWFGPTDFLQIGNAESDLAHNAVNSPESRLIGGALLENKDKAAKASPITFVSKAAPPFLIMHGDRDRTVPFNQSELLFAALKKAGVDATFIPMKGAGHGFGGPEAIRPVQEFLKRTLNAATQSAASTPPPASSAITTGSLLEEMSNLERLAHWPKPAFRTVQFSSFDRRSTTSEAPGWFSNADGFGREPIPNFQKVLRPPRDGKPGLYLMAETDGPGAIVRGWSAGMEGVLRVWLDPGPDLTNTPGALVWEGPAYEFLARRSSHYFKQAGLVLDLKDAFSQQDADYFPIPFQRGLRVTYEGHPDRLHFYHLQVRLYPAGTAVQTFDAKRDLTAFEPQVRAAASNLCQPPTPEGGEPLPLEGAAAPGATWTWTPSSKGPGAIRELTLRLHSDSLPEALRACLLRISFDGSQRPQVESPVGDFFASGPGVNPFGSLPLTVSADGQMTCRFVMPFETSVRIELVNHSKTPVRIAGSVRLSNWLWNEHSLYFRAKWRVDHDLLAGAGALDLPYAVVIGQGLLVGCAAMIMNPSGVPTAGGNWWGEGDEKILVDGETVPSTFGTGSEDYFNYAWSRPDLFSHPFCGQPLDSGPDTAGYVSNHRFQVLDAIPFERSLAFLMELWAHNRTPGLSYARITYYYARPGAIDDHRALSPSDLRVPPLPKRELKALGGATGARFFLPDQLQPRPSAGRIETQPFPLATQLQVSQWSAQKGERLSLTVPVEKSGKTALHLVAVHQPGGATIRAFVDGKPAWFGGSETVALTAAAAPRVLNLHLKPIQLDAGSHELLLECVDPGSVGLDYLWVKTEP